MFNSLSFDQPFLTFSQIRNVFHELGHALHVALSKTDHQLINGARVHLDFAEIPSNFTEHFIYDYKFVKKWAIDQNDEPIDKLLFDKIVIKERLAEMIDLEETSYYSLLDLKFHSLKDTMLSEQNLKTINSEVLPKLNPHGDKITKSTHSMIDTLAKKADAENRRLPKLSSNDIDMFSSHFDKRTYLYGKNFQLFLSASIISNRR